MTITFFSSTTAITPILFVNYGQEASGTIDFSLLSTVDDSSSLTGNVNFYNINQFNNPFHPVNNTEPEQPQNSYAAANDVEC